MAESKVTAPDATTESVTQAEDAPGRWTVQRVTVLAVAIFVGVYLVIFATGIIAALVWDDGAAAFFRYLRDLITIGLALTSMLIIIGIGILIIQIARLVNLLRSEVQPISEDGKQAVRNVRTTTEFVQKRAVEPIIQTYSFLAGLTTFLLEIVRLSRVLQQRDGEANQPQESVEEARQ